MGRYDDPHVRFLRRETYLDDKTVPVETFWEKLIGGAEVKTSQPSPQAFLKEFEEAKQVGDEVISVVISTELSGTYQGAMVARSMAGYEPVYIVDGKARRRKCGAKGACDACLPPARGGQADGGAEMPRSWRSCAIMCI